MTGHWYDQPDAREAAASGEYGRVLKLARTVAGLTQGQAGVLAGYSAATVSRLESGATRLTDIATLRHLAEVFGVPPSLFGLATADASHAADQPGKVRAGTEGGGQMQRREVLTGLAALTGIVLFPVPALADQGITAGLDELLFSGRHVAVPAVTPGQLRTMLATAQRDFRNCRYRQLATNLPGLLRTAEATRDSLGVEQRGIAETLVSDGYALATDVLTKLHENGAAWATADRAVRAAVAAGDPRALARAQRLAAIVLRRSAHRDKAQTMVLDAAHRFASATGCQTSADASLYASMLCTTAYTASLTDRRDNAYAMLDEAGQVVAENGAAEFGSNDITLYGVGVARALGDFGRAVEYSRAVNLDLLGTAERHARYWEDTALAWWGRGRPDAAFASMLRAERAAPQEVRYRPWAQQLATNLLESNATIGLSGLREFAARTGVA